jgi:phosphoribosylaminoimidazolecarboxamide formyltransferase/IMP cyclohydrolase
MSRLVVRRALLSVSDKSGLIPFASGLAAAGVTLVSSGGTAAALADAGIPVTPVDEVTGSPEMLGGRVKTLHPGIHGGILADPSNPDHLEDLEAAAIEPFQLVVVNLYPFEATASALDATAGDVIEQIDIGGPAMIRSAAKNSGHVGVVTHPGQYVRVLEAVVGGGIDADLRQELAAAAFYRTARYDAAIVGWFERNTQPPSRTILALERRDELRYGEDPHQEAASYAVAGADPWWVEANQLQGKAMSFNNYLDAEAAWRVVNDFDEAAAVVVKHANPCGLAVRPDLPAAFTAAWECDPLSAFGGIVAVNRTLDEVTAAGIAAAGFVEVVVAPDVAAGAREALAAKQNLRLLQAPPPDPSDLDLRRIEGGFVIQQRDRVRTGREDWEVVGRRAPEPEETEGLAFAWTVAAHAKSNAIVVARDLAAVGVGAGDQSRVGAAERAIAKAGERTRGAVAASDAFLPFRDTLDTLAASGVTAIVEPGGSKRDAEVIAAADEHGVALVFTGRRHFRH